LRGGTDTQQRLGIDRDDKMIHMKDIDAGSKGIFRISNGLSKFRMILELRNPYPDHLYSNRED